MIKKKTHNNTPSLPKNPQKEKTVSCLIRVLLLNSLFEKQFLSQDYAYYYLQYITQLECVYMKIR